MVRKEYKKTPNHHVQNKKVDYHIDENVRREVDSFLRTSGKEATIQLVSNLKKQGANDSHIKQIIMKAVYADIMKHNRNADKGRIYFSQMPDEMIKDFSADQFILKNWKFVPYVLKSNDYSKLISSLKYPLFIKGYNYNAPLYAFKNRYDFNVNAKSRNRKDGKISLNDFQYFIDRNDKIMFVKEVKTKYHPISLKIVRARKRNLGDNADKIIYDSNAYERTLSISMYVLLDGNPNKAFPYFRYDSSNHSHNNLYIGNDKRKDIFGQIAESPHFHFQNEEDNLLCIKKFIGNDRHTKFKTGRCNAIDIPHLKKYLNELDNKSQEELEDEYQKNMTYGMPFLEYKFKNKKLQLSYNKIIEQFSSTLTEEQLEVFNDILNTFNLKSDYSQTKENNNKFFNPLIKSLDLLQYLHNYITLSENDLDALERKEILSNLEILFANNVVDGICRNSSYFLEKKYKPAFIIEANYLNKTNVAPDINKTGNKEHKIQNKNAKEKELEFIRGEVGYEH